MGILIRKLVIEAMRAGRRGTFKSNKYGDKGQLKLKRNSSKNNMYI